MAARGSSVAQPVNCGCRVIGVARLVVAPAVPLGVWGVAPVVAPTVVVVVELGGTGSPRWSKLANAVPGAGKGIPVDSGPAA